MKHTVYTYDPFNLRHTLDGHPENFRRLETTWDLLQQDGILRKLSAVPSKAAPLESLLRVHTPQYIQRLEAASMFGGGRLDSDTYIGSDSYQAARLAAGGLLSVVDAVMHRKADNGFALVRPPGHHALPYLGMGFCLLANVAIAARWAQDHHGAERVLIVDFDVHHGNGTQDIFLKDPSVLFFSTHQFPYYPGTGAADETGEGRAAGTTINVPFPAYVGDQGYLRAFREVLAPAARKYRPNLILVSAGYDAHWMDPLASMRLTITGYMALVQELMALADELCRGRLVFVLEGGYHLDVLSHSVLSTLRALSGSPTDPSDPYGQPRIGAERDVSSLLDRIKQLHGIRSAPYRSIA